MADLSTMPPLEPSSIRTAHEKIEKHVHRTPVLTSRSINAIASSSNGPRFNIHFKCENMQRIGAFKARGAFHAVLHLIDELGIDEMRKRGVVTHSSGNHAQALALAASEFGIPAHIVMPTISTPSKIAGTQAYTDKVYFSGSTSQEREAVVAEVMQKTGSILVPPYDHPDIMLGQGTAALELDEERPNLHAILAPCGGGGLLSGTAVYFSDKPTLVFGCEPSYQGANDAERGLREGKRIETVKTLTIADGLRTPLGVHTWNVVTGKSDKGKMVENVHSCAEYEIKEAMRLVCERLKVFVEPSAVVPLAVVLYNKEFRRYVADKQGGETWDIGIILSGGNTTIDAIVGIFGQDKGEKEVRAEGKVGMDGNRVAENVAG